MRAAILSSLLLFVIGSAEAAFQPPALTGPVVDEAGILDARTARGLERALRALNESGGSQINVLTIKSLDGSPIEEAGIRTFDAWKLGGKKTDNGAILLIAPVERKVRIEVGQGLEGSLTDADSRRIISETILPLFRAGDFSKGALVGTYEIVRKTDPDFKMEPYLEGQARRISPDHEGIPRRLWIFLGLIFLFLLFRSRGGGGGFGTGLLLGSILNGGGRSYGGPSDWGGGWSGGGGSGSGGGASGDW